MISIWWFFVLIIIFVGVVISVGAFNSGDIDSKKIEADILASKFIDCVVDNGYINLKLLEGEAFFQGCNLNKKLINESNLYYLEFKLYNYEDCEITGEKIKKLECKNPIEGGSGKFGNFGFEVLCFQEGKHYPLCSEKYVHVLDEKRERLILHVVAGSNQEIKAG